jgi:hypothetical protein
VSDRGLSELLIGDCYGSVVWASTDETAKTQTYTFTRSSGTIGAGNAPGSVPATTVVGKGTLALDYGTSGNGYIESVAQSGAMASGVPYQQMVTWATAPGVTGNRTVRTRTGNLNGSYGYVADIFGFAAGQYGTAAKTWITVDETNGIRIGSNATVLGNWQADGDLFLGTDISAAATTNLVIFNTAQTYNSESVAVGDLLIGDNSSSKANIFWDKSAGTLNFRGGTTTQAYISTTGAITAGAGAVTIDANGITQANPDFATYGDTGKIKWGTGSEIGAYYDVEAGGKEQVLYLYSIGHASGGVGYISLAVQPYGGATQNTLTVASNGSMSWDGGANFGTATGAGTGAIKASGQIQGDSLMATAASNPSVFFNDTGHYIYVGSNHNLYYYYNSTSYKLAGPA